MIAPLVSVFMTVIVVLSEEEEKEYDLQDCANFGKGQRAECTALPYCKHRNGDVGGQNCYPIEPKQCKRIKDPNICDALLDKSQDPVTQPCQWNLKNTKKRDVAQKNGKCNAKTAFQECSELNGKGRRTCKQAITTKTCTYNKLGECTEVQTINGCGDFKSQATCHKHDEGAQLICIWWPNSPKPGVNPNDDFSCRDVGSFKCADMVVPLLDNNRSSYKKQCEDKQDYGDNMQKYHPEGKLDLPCLWTERNGDGLFACHDQEDYFNWTCEDWTEADLCATDPAPCDWNKRRDPKCKDQE